MAQDILDYAAQMAGVGAIQNNLRANPDAKAVASQALTTVMEKGNFSAAELRALHVVSKNPNVLEQNELARLRAGSLEFRKQARFVRIKIAGNTKILGNSATALTSATTGVNNIVNSKLDATLVASHIKVQYAYENSDTPVAIGLQSFENIGSISLPAAIANSKLVISQDGGRTYEFLVKDFFAKNAQVTNVSPESTALAVTPIILTKDMQINMELVVPDGTTLTKSHYLHVEFIGSEFSSK
jgi:hypothetical protein